MEKGLANLANAVSDFLKGPPAKELNVGEFVGSFLPRATGGVGLRQKVIQSLKGAGVKVTETASLQLQGRFAVIDKNANGETFNSVALQVTYTIIDRSDEEVGKFTDTIFSENALQFVGASGDIPPTSSNPNETAKRERVKKETIRNPTVAIVGNEVRTTNESPFGIEVMVRRGSGRDPRKPSIRDEELSGQMAFVPMAGGEEYVIRLHNRSSEEVAVALTIDGLSMFAFADKDIFGGQVIVDKQSHVDIPGWVITPNQTDVFEVSNYAKSAAATMGTPPTNVGTITASFFKSSPAANEKDPLATMRGRQIEQKYVPVPRVIGDMKAIISVRYDREK